MTTTTYKGFNITIEKDSSAHPDRAYMAYINISPRGARIITFFLIDSIF